VEAPSRLVRGSDRLPGMRWWASGRISFHVGFREEAGDERQGSSHSRCSTAAIPGSGRAAVCLNGRWSARAVSRLIDTRSRVPKRCSSSAAPAESRVHPDSSSHL
jgi:hypothetical protein